MRLRIPYKMNPHQREFHEDVTSKLLHLSTGFGGGKTHALCMKALKLSYLNRHLPGGLVCPDYQDFRRDLKPLLEDILERARIPYEFNQQAWTYRLPWGRAPMYVVSAEKKIRGPNWAWACLNEVTLLPLVRYKEVIGRVRLRNASVPQVASCGTPEGFGSEYFEYFIEKPPKGLRIVYGSTVDNAANLSETYLDMLADSYDQRMLAAYRDGKWIPMSGNRFYYAYDPHRNEQDVPVQDDLSFYCSIDYNVDPFCAAIWQFYDGRLVGVDEVELAGGEGYSTERMVTALKTRGYTPKNTVMFPDPAGAARSTKGMPDNKVLEQAGYEVRVKTSAPRIRQRQLNVNNLFEKRLITVNPKKQPGVRRDLIGVEQDPVTLEKKKSNPRLTHFSDGLDYMADILFPFSGHRPTTRQETIR
jgi:hypothetical protein